MINIKCCWSRCENKATNSASNNLNKKGYLDMCAECMADFQVHLEAREKMNLEKGKAEAMSLFDSFIKDRTCLMQQFPHRLELVKFIPFEWEDFKKEINKEETGDK